MADLPTAAVVARPPDQRPPDERLPDERPPDERPPAERTPDDRLAEVEADNERLRRRLATLAEEAARSAERARLHAADSAALRQLLTQAQRHVEALTSSTSWRLTRPLRAVIEPVRRVASRRRVRPPPPPPLPLTPVRRPGPLPGFPLPGDIACHPALLPAPLPPLPQTVSVVIPTWNAGPELHWLLRKLQAQRGLGGLQIVLVDSGSIDGTPELAVSLGCEVVPIDRAEFSHSAARNLGASVATGDLLLFMVQDAYPIGDDWLAGLAHCLLHPAREEDRLAAVSCAEFCRTDSELIYDVMARGHYEFLGCADGDRVGRLVSSTQEDLRRQGQLSDVACLMTRHLFETFRFQGRYAEDLTLGIRLIEAGHQVAMLSSIRVAHAHRRPAAYYVRRVFVDVVFLAGVFADFSVQPGADALGAVTAAAALVRLLRPLSSEPRNPPITTLERVTNRLRDASLRPADLPAAAHLGAADFGFAPLGEWIGRLVAERGAAGRSLSPAEQRGAEALRETVVARLGGIQAYVAEAWPVADPTTLGELDHAVSKTLAMSLGAQLAFCYLADATRVRSDPLMAELKPLLLAGI